MRRSKENLKEITLKELDQLHATLMEFNKNSMEIKKLYIGIIPILGGFLVKIPGEIVSLKIFSGIIVFTGIIFLCTDYIFYVGQRSVRRIMAKKTNKLLSTNTKSSDDSKCKIIFGFIKSSPIYLITIFAGILGIFFEKEVIEFFK